MQLHYSVLLNIWAAYETYGEKTTYTHNFWVFKPKLSTQVCQRSVYHYTRSVSDTYT